MLFNHKIRIDFSIFKSCATITNFYSKCVINFYSKCVLNFKLKQTNVSIDEKTCHLNLYLSLKSSIFIFIYY